MSQTVDGSTVGGQGLRFATVVVASLRRGAEESFLLDVVVVSNGAEETWLLVDVLAVPELGVLAIERRS